MAKAKSKLFSKLPKADKLKEALNLFAEAVSVDSNWQEDAEKAFAFAASDQWTPDQRRVLKIENRPCLTWNFIKGSIDIVMGIVEQNRVRIVPQPVTSSGTRRLECP